MPEPTPCDNCGEFTFVDQVEFRRNGELLMMGSGCTSCWIFIRDDQFEDD